MARNPTSPRAPRIPGVHDLREAARSAELGMLPEGTRRQLDEVRKEIYRLLDQDELGKRAARRAGRILDAQGILAQRDPVHEPGLRRFIATEFGAGAVPVSSPGGSFDLTQLPCECEGLPWTRHDLLCRRASGAHFLARVCVRRNMDGKLEWAVRREDAKTYDFPSAPRTVAADGHAGSVVLLGGDTVVQLKEKGLSPYRRADLFGDGWAAVFHRNYRAFFRLDGKFSKSAEYPADADPQPVARFRDRAVAYAGGYLHVVQKSPRGVAAWHAFAHATCADKRRPDGDDKDCPKNRPPHLHGMTWADERGGEPFFAAVRPDGGWDVLDWELKKLRPATARETARIPKTPALGRLAPHGHAAPGNFALAPTDRENPWTGVEWGDAELQVPVLVDWGRRNSMGRAATFLACLGDAIGTGMRPFGKQQRSPVVGTSKSLLYVHQAAVDAVVRALHERKVRGESIAARKLEPGEPSFEVSVSIPAPGFHKKHEAAIRASVARWLGIADPAAVKKVSATPEKILAEVPAAAVPQLRWEMIKVVSLGDGPAWDPKRKYASSQES